MSDNRQWIRRTLLSTALLLVYGSSTHAETLATMGGKPITRAEVEASTSEQLRSLQTEYDRNRFRLVESALQKLIEERVLAAEKKTREELLAAENLEVTAAEVDAFYEEKKAEIPRTKAEAAPLIRQFLLEQKQHAAWLRTMAALQKKHGVSIVMEPMRTAVAAVGPTRGKASAPVTIVEFADFQCQFCRGLSATLEQVMTKYGEKVRLVLRHFPLDFHAEAQKAAEASMCAADQGKFWQMHDALYANQKALGVDQLKVRARELGLDAPVFDQCLDSGKHAELVRADWKAGVEAGVSGTPAIFINGRYISGAQPLEALAVVIDEELQRKAKP